MAGQPCNQMGSCRGGHCWLTGGEDGEAGSELEAHSSCRAMSVRSSTCLSETDSVEQEASYKCLQCKPCYISMQSICHD